MKWKRSRMRLGPGCTWECFSLNCVRFDAKLKSGVKSACVVNGAEIKKELDAD